MTPILLLVACLQGVNLDAEAGFKREVFPDSWTRVSATLSYEGEPLEAELVITPRTHFNERVVYRRPVQLVRKARMRLGYDVYLTGQEYAIDVDLVAGGKVVRTASFPLNVLRKEGGRFLVVGTPPPFIVEAMAKRPPITMVRLPAEFLPPTPLSLLSVDTILIPEPIDLDPAQESALQSWVEQGGKLIFGAGRSTHLRQNPFWRDRCPLGGPLLATASVRVKESDVAVTVVRGSLLRGRSTLNLGTDPLVVRAREGDGEVVFMPVILDQPNLARVMSGPAALAEVMDLPPPPPPPLPGPPRPGLPRVQEWLDRDPKAGISQDTEEFMRRLLPPEFRVRSGPLTLGIGAVVLYIVLIGPVEYFRLRRKGALKKGWRSFAVLVVLFVGLILLWGEYVHPRQSKGVLVTIRDDHRVHTFGAFRPQRGGVYEFEAAGATSPLAPSRVFGAADPPELLTVNLLAGIHLPVPPGASRLLVSSRAVEETDGALRVEWTTPQKTALAVKHTAPYPLKECWAVSKESVWRLGEIPAGFTGSRDLGEPYPFPKWAGEQRRGPFDRPWWEDRSPWEMLDASRVGLVLTFHSAMDEAWNAKRSRRRLQLRGIDLSPLLERGEVVVVGSFDQNLSGIRPRPEIPAETFGWARAPVREASR